MSLDDLGDVLREVDEWVRDFNQRGETKIQQVWYNDTDMESDGDCLFFVVEGKYSEVLEDAVTDFDVRLAVRHPDVSLDFLIWPCGYKSAGSQGFKEKVFDYVG